MAKQIALNWIDQNTSELVELSDAIWDYAEAGFLEHKSADAQIALLEKHGFTIEKGVAGMPTAFVASYGSGQPVIGLLGEYDALPGLSQKVHFEKEAASPGAPGHGCGHNLLGAGTVGGVIATKVAMQQQGLQGTIRYYGCPAEELLAGKVYMVRDGLFDDVDISLAWHPFSETAVNWDTSQAMNSVVFNFYGRTSHAAGDPESGRSALDAVELMNVGANYLREHVSPDVRIHYVITDGGGEPNVVPAHAKVWYYVRAPLWEQVEEVYARLQKVAEGAALMTETSFDITFLTGCYNTIQNDVIGQVLLDCIHEVGVPQWDAAEQEFARKIIASYQPGHYDKAVASFKRQYGVDLSGKYLNDAIVSFTDKTKVSLGSTDVGDVSWVVPTAQFNVASSAIGTPGHSWQFCAASGMSIGHKGMLVAAKIFALATLHFLADANLVTQAKLAFQADTKDTPYVSPLPADQEPPLTTLQH